MDDLIGAIGALLVGNRTFRGADPYKGVVAKEGQPGSSIIRAGPTSSANASA